MNVHIEMAGLTLGLCTIFAGFHGMNVINGFEELAVARYYVVLGFFCSNKLFELPQWESCESKSCAATRGIEALGNKYDNSHPHSKLKKFTRVNTSNSAAAGK